jgi:hypothetical protein
MQSDSPEDQRRLNKLIAEHLVSDIEWFGNIPAWTFQERFPEWLAIDPTHFEGTGHTVACRGPAQGCGGTSPAECGGPAAEPCVVRYLDLMTRN